MKLFVGQNNPTIGAIESNVQHIVEAIEEAKRQKCELAVFPEMAICGYNPEDLLLEPGFVASCDEGLMRVRRASSGISVIVGTVRESLTSPGKPFRNSAAVIVDGEVVGFQDKCLLPTYDVFDEWRYFEPAKSERIWQIGQEKVGITICEDIWPAYDSFCEGRYHDDPLDCFEGKGLDLFINISASPYALSKIKRRRQVAKQVATRLGCPVLIANQVGANDGILFDGTSVMVSAHGDLLFQAKSFAVDWAISNSHTPIKEVAFKPGQELYNALVMGVRDYFVKQGFKKACFGLSGGIDSAVAACIAKEALGKENVLGVLLPSRYTSEESREDALQVAKNLGIETKEISIEGLNTSLLEALGPHFEGITPDVTEENIQSRVRAVLLMALSNKLGYLVLNTGNKSEIAMGYTTLYGDAVGAIGVLADLLKCQVYEVAHYINELSNAIPERVIQKVPTAELRPNQKDSDTIPEYAILDPIVDDFIVHNLSSNEICKKHGFKPELVQEVIRKIHQSEYKRRQLPFALRVSEKAFSVGRRVPIVQRYSS